VPVAELEAPAGPDAVVGEADPLRAEPARHARLLALDPEPRGEVVELADVHLAVAHGAAR
jgi:hypothetical protein